MITLRMSAFAVVVTLCLCSCSTANQFADRTQDYNFSAEQAQDQTMLLNILRAKDRRPMVFTELTTISGSGPLSGQLGLTVALRGAKPATAMPQVSLSGGPALTVGVVDTDTFYKGILSPVPLSTLDLLIQAKFPKEMLFNLLFAKIVVTRPSDSTYKEPFSEVFDNNVQEPVDVNKYQKAISALLKAGLTTGPLKSDGDDVGPVLAPEEVAGALGVKASTAGLKIEQRGWCDLDDDQQSDLKRRLKLDLHSIEGLLDVTCTAAEEPSSENLSGAADRMTPDSRASLWRCLSEAKSEGDRSDCASDAVARALAALGAPVQFFAIQKPGSSSVHLCYDAVVGGSEGAPSASLCNPKLARQSGSPRSGAARRQAAALGASESLCSTLFSGTKGRCGDEGWRKGLQFEFIPLSTEGVIYHLGEVLRVSSLDKSDGSGREVKICWSDDPTDCQPLFRLVKDTSDRYSFLVVKYNGHNYAMPRSEESGRTYQVFDLALDLVALNRSAKDLPVSNVFTLVGSP